MKRIERNTYNSIKRNTTADTINVEIPVEYSHEARQAIHEYLTINGMRVTGINWNSIQECYCIHWEPARTETAEAIRRQQENADIDDVTDGMEYSDWTWDGYRKPQEAPQAAPAAEAEQQPTTTEEAPQAATQAAQDADEKKEDKTMTTTEREALERINARQNAANLFTNIGPADIAAELADMEAERTTPAPAPEDITPTDEQKEEVTPMSNTTANELQNYVDRIADDLRKLYEHEPTEEEREAAEENGDACDLYTYFADVLDIEYTISSRGDYLGARIAVALGGPNIYIDTREGEVKGYWGTDRAERWIPSEICEEVDSIMEEYYDMVRGA